MEEFFDQNPISQIGLIVLKGKRAEKVCDLTGSCRKHIKAIKLLHKIGLHGEPSLQNGLELAHQTLKLIPSHASREILIIMGSLTTCDPTNILDTVATLKRDGVRCSVVSLSAEIRICKYLTQETGGVYGAVLDDSHYKDQLLQHIDPPPAAKLQDNSLIKMGFPHGENEERTKPVLTMCMWYANIYGIKIFLRTVLKLISILNSVTSTASKSPANYQQPVIIVLSAPANTANCPSNALPAV